MKWGRGFFRAWLLLTALWVLVTAWLTYADYLAEGRYKEGYIATKSETKEYVVLSGGEWIACAGSETSADQAREKNLEPCGRTKTYRLLRESAWIILPPASLLTLGLGIAWVVAGFRPSPKKLRYVNEGPRRGPARPLEAVSYRS